MFYGIFAINDSYFLFFSFLIFMVMKKSTSLDSHFTLAFAQFYFRIPGDTRIKLGNVKNTSQELNTQISLTNHLILQLLPTAFH